MIATDIPTGAAPRRRVPRRAARDRRPGGDVRAGRQGGAPRAAADAVGRARPPRPSPTRSRPRRARSTSRSPTDLLAAEVAGARLARTALRARRAATRSSPRRVALLDAAERPLVWAGGGARDARRRGRARWPSGSARRSSPPTARAGSSRRPPVRGRPPAARPRPPGALWDEADLVLAIGSDLDGMKTQNFAQPQPTTLIAISLEPLVELPRRRRAQRRRGRGRRRARGRRCATAAASTRWTQRLAAARAQTCATLDGTALRFLDAIHFAVPDDGVLVVDMCIPGYWLAGLPPPAAPRRLQFPLGWGTLGYAFPAALGAALAGAGPGRLDLRRRRLPVRLRRAGHARPGADPADRGDRRRRRLRDAALRPGAAPATRRYGVDLHTPDFAALAAAFGVRAETVDGLDDAFGEALARHVADPAPVACSSPAPRSRSSRRRPPRRTGTASGRHRGELVSCAPLRCTADHCSGRSGGTPDRRGARRGPSGPSGACRRSPSSSTASG